ncbi:MULTISPECIES: ABC transporter substrate-binding protein [unclassified Rhodococcus (in: high G+C Gram-positive bacteria)]|uniref:ABC transporter substrate-binding protein n=1 Tax=unclassified Rhodococcus (in: high G+C Gram-positive bacteria) TaxID=192944 RepID=UPI00163AAC92|nr:MULTISPECIES: ABC transporter substrate-binding protein [unclassified Rhodococcus (in: high G+C Gram-positive bacteria)]MBC2642488.1 amino acid ABC transporter substrate-binding protein [Rhodococcus sp. 3A]MBC2892770.1 amino acid ABC transporter substrate-binding protein [Rhodococcus sp. 4CII]
MTASARVLRVGSALPDPPFEFRDGGAPAGFDVEYTQAIARVLGVEWSLVPYRGTDFNGIFDALADGEFDCIASGTTVTPDRRARADFCAPYLVSGQSLAVDTSRHPGVRGVGDLAGLTVGVQHGNTSQPIVERLVADGRVGAIRVYAYDRIGQALDDLSSGGCDAVMKLAPVLTWLVRDRPHVEVVERGISREEIAVAVRTGDHALRERLECAQRTLGEDGTLDRLRSTWLGVGETTGDSA